MQDVDTDAVTLIAPTVHREPSGESWLEAGRAKVECTVNCTVDGTHSAAKQLVRYRREAASYVARQIASDRTLLRLDPRDVSVSLLVHPGCESVTITATAMCNRRGSEPRALLRDAAEDAIDLVLRMPGAGAAETNRDAADASFGTGKHMRTSVTTTACTRRCFRFGALRGHKWFRAPRWCVRRRAPPIKPRELPVIELA